jgi:hypothetical protein
VGSASTDSVPIVLTKAPDWTNTTRCSADASSTPCRCGNTSQTKSSTESDAERQSAVCVWMLDTGLPS